ncbi:MAG: hypothetical protein ACPL68_03105, partial [Candidatus Hydrothermia bacterium]
QIAAFNDSIGGKEILVREHTVAMANPTPPNLSNQGTLTTRRYDLYNFYNEKHPDNLDFRALLWWTFSHYEGWSMVRPYPWEGSDIPICYPTPAYYIHNLYAETYGNPANKPLACRDSLGTWSRGKRFLITEDGREALLMTKRWLKDDWYHHLSWSRTGAALVVRGPLTEPSNPPPWITLWELNDNISVNPVHDASMERLPDEDAYLVFIGRQDGLQVSKVYDNEAVRPLCRLFPNKVILGVTTAKGTGKVACLVKKYDGELWYLEMDFNGTLIGQVEQIYDLGPTNDCLPSMCLKPEGTPVVVFEEGGKIKLTEKTGQTWTPPILLCEGYNPAVAMGNVEPLVAFRSHPDELSPHKSYIKVYDCWSRWIYTIGVAQGPCQIPWITVVNNHPYITWAEMEVVAVKRCEIPNPYKLYSYALHIAKGKPFTEYYPPGPGYVWKDTLVEHFNLPDVIIEPKGTFHGLNSSWPQVIPSEDEDSLYFAFTYGQYELFTGGTEAYRIPDWFAPSQYGGLFAWMPEVQPLGGKGTVYWQADSGITSIMVLLSEDGGESYDTLTSGLNPSLKQYTFPCPNYASGKLRLMLQALDENGELVAQRVLPFRTAHPSAVPYITYGNNSKKVIASQGGELHMVYSVADGMDRTTGLPVNPKVFWTKSQDYGENWNPPTLIGSGFLPTIGLRSFPNGEEIIAIAWVNMDSSGTNRLLYAYRSKGDAAWSPAVSLGNLKYACSSPSLVFQRNPKKVHIAVDDYDTTANKRTITLYSFNYNKPNKATSSVVATWTPTRQLTKDTAIIDAAIQETVIVIPPDTPIVVRDTLRDTVRIPATLCPSVAIDYNGTLHMAYDANDTVFYAFKRPDDPSWTRIQVSHPGEPARNPSLDVYGNLVHITWEDKGVYYQRWGYVELPGSFLDEDTIAPNPMRGSYPFTRKGAGLCWQAWGGPGKIPRPIGVDLARYSFAQDAWMKDSVRFGIGTPTSFPTFESYWDKSKAFDWLGWTSSSLSYLGIPGTGCTPCQHPPRLVLL